MTDSICEVVRKMETNYTTGTTQMSKYVEFDMYETINKIDAALNSKFLNGDKDSLEREKPYFNISIAVANIWYRATNIAKNKIRMAAKRFSHKVLALVATLHVWEWMNRENFEEFLDKWGITLSRYCSAVVKFVEKDGKLHASVIPWNRIICDQVKFEGNPQIEILEFNASQLRQQGYDEAMVEALIETEGAARETLNKEKKDNKDGYFKVYEIHHTFSMAQYKKYHLGEEPSEGDEKVFFPQMYAVSFVGVGKDESGNDKYEDFVLASGKEDKSPYMITHLLEEDGRTLGIGPIEMMFDAQWMKNHTVKQTKDVLDFASLLILQTADGSLVGRNVLQSLVTGDILIHEQDSPLSQVNTSHDITQIQSFGREWQGLVQEMTSTPDAIRGNTQPSGTAFRTVAVENKEANSLFEVFRRTKKRYLGRMLREFILPHVKKKMDTSEEIAATLESQDITMLDRMYVPNKAILIDNQQIKDKVLNGEIAYNLDKNLLEQDIQKGLNQLGNQRFIKPSDIPTATWKQALKDFEWEVDIDETDKETDDDLVAQTLIDLFKSMVNPATQQFVQTPQGRFLFNKVLESTKAISPLELPQDIQQAAQPMPAVGGSSSVQPNQPMMAGMG